MQKTKISWGGVGVGDPETKLNVPGVSENRISEFVHPDGVLKRGGGEF